VVHEDAAEWAGDLGLGGDDSPAENRAHGRGQGESSIAQTTRKPRNAATASQPAALAILAVHTRPGGSGIRSGWQVLQPDRPQPVIG